jgi:dolichyl-diphosphooligosaccharide--protein glycosyltransferase
MMRGRGRNGGQVMIDDFREAYWWVRDNTAKDSRIMCVCLHLARAMACVL